MHANKLICSRAKRDRDKMKNTAKDTHSNREL